VPAISWDDVIDLDANLENVAPNLQDVILGRVEKLSASYYGGVDDPRYKLARILLAAHIGTPYANAAGGGAGVSGPVTSRTEGGVSESYAVAAVSLTGSHSSTGHGRAFDELTRSMPARIGPLRS
jgi:hypothetical protein